MKRDYRTRLFRSVIDTKKLYNKQQLKAEDELILLDFL